MTEISETIFNNPVGRPKVTVEIDPHLLRRIRKEKGFKQCDVACVVNLTPARVTQFESGYGGVPLNALKKIGIMLDVDYKIFVIDNKKAITKIRSWSKAEDDILFKYYPLGGIKSVREKLPQRSRNSIINRVRLRGIPDDTVGTRRVTKDGYARIKLSTAHPLYKKYGNWISEHTLVWYKSYPEDREILLNGGSIHHKNGIRSDNRPENLEIWISNHRAGQRVKDIIEDRAYKLIEELGYTKSKRE